MILKLILTLFATASLTTPTYYDMEAVEPYYEEDFVEVYADELLEDDFYETTLIEPELPEPIIADTEDEPFLGAADAQVTIIEFSDYECPACSRFTETTFQEIKTRYIDTGKVKFIHKDFPLEMIHQNAYLAANAGECIREQAGDIAFFEYYDILANNTLERGNLIEHASEIEGINTTEFTECLDTEKHADNIDADSEEASTLGISGTPTFIINGQKLGGAQPFSVFEEMIDAELNEF